MLASSLYRPRLAVPSGSCHFLRPTWMVESASLYPQRGMSRDRICSPSASPSKTITVVDVYDLAASIGKDFEMLIDQFGKEAIVPIMPKVISALETLESLANFNEKENEEIIDLQKTIDRLENDKQLKMQDRMKFDLELEQVEENYKKEINDLWATVKKLQGENKHLSSALEKHENKESEEDENSLNGQGYRDADIQIIDDLREENQRRKDELKVLQHDAEETKVEVDNLHGSIEKLIRQNQELLRKNSSLQKQGRVLVQEKTECNRRLQVVEEHNIQLRNLLNDTSRACKDLQTQKLQEDDPENAPRFTLAELREVLQEKNMLKGRVLELEEQLEQLRPSSTECVRKSDIEPIKTSQSTPQLSAPPASSAPSEDSVSEECVVYGPINREPDEKLKPWKYERKDSGVRRFFRFFYKGNFSPRRESSTTPVPIPAHPLGN